MRLHLVLPCFALFACSPGLATLQPARTVPAGHVQISAGIQGTVPTGLPGEALETARIIDDLEGGARPHQIGPLVESSIAGLLVPPSIDAHLGFAYGVSQRFELDAKIGPTGIGAGFRLQLLRMRPGIYLALGAMAHFQWMDFDVERFTDDAQINRLTRYDFSFPLSFGYSGRYLHVWGGPKLVMTRFTADATLCFRSRGGVCRQEVAGNASGRVAHFAGQGGIAVGKGRVWVAVELTVARAWVRGDLSLSGGGARQNNGFSRSGRVVVPAIGLITWW